ncbi:MAG: hypothetical protein R2729_19510 [Bryobacteraceae bacterium]
MPDTVMPYVERKPRDLITAEDWNEMQILIRKDIDAQLRAAIAAIQQVPKSADSTKLGGKTPEELAQQIIDSALQDLNKRTGYMRVFKKLQPSVGTQLKISYIEHELKDYPVTDVYQLTPFAVICSEDDIKERRQVLFYLYHSSEKKIRTKVADGAIVEADIEPAGELIFKIPFSKMLELYNVPYDDESSLGDLETEFWEAFYTAPNDEFDDGEDCHSPWFDRCCGDRRTVGELKRRGDWDELWFQTRPIKTVNPELAGRLPQNVAVGQLDFDRVAMTYIPAPPGNDQPVPQPLPVMVLLKV